MTDDEINEIPLNEVSDYDRAQAIAEAKRERVLDDSTAHPVHMLFGLASWLATLPAPPPIDWFVELFSDVHPVSLATRMLSGDARAAYELMDRFRDEGGAHWTEAVENAMGDIPDADAAADVAEAELEAAEIAETQAYLMWR